MTGIPAALHSLHTVRSKAPPLPASIATMTYSPDWTVEEPPTDRKFLALAVAAGMLDEPVMVVAEWDEAADGWRTVKIPGDTMIGIRLNIVCWTELPEAPLVG